MAFNRVTLLLLLVNSLHALPTEPELAMITPAPTPTRDLAKRNIFSDVDSYVNSIFTELGTAIPSYVQNGILPGFVNLPTGDAVLKSAKVSSTDLDTKPTQVLNIPGYGNWTDLGWNLRIHGNIFKQPDIDNETINDLANKFLFGTSIEQLPPSQSAQAANLTREIFVVQQSNLTAAMNLSPAPSFGSDGTPGGGGGQTPPGGDQTIDLPPTTAEGDFDGFFPLQNVSGGGLIPGNGTLPAQRLELHATGTDTGNATSYLVSENGLTIVSDIDDILRVTRIYQPKDGLLNSFARPYRQWMNMPDIYRNWSTSLPNMHFHYLTTTPEQITRNYMQFIYDTYPGGSFDTRPLNFSDVQATLSIRKYLLIKIFETFPQRKFILVADTSNSDVMKDYPEMATLFPGQVQCIFLRNTTHTDPGDKFPYNTKGFKNLNQRMYMFFRTPDDLTNLDIVNGQCYNASVPQNVTFGYQGLPFGLSTGDGKSSDAPRSPGSMATRSLLIVALAAAVGVLAMNGL